MKGKPFLKMSVSCICMTADHHKSVWIRLAVLFVVVLLVTGVMVYHYVLITMNVSRVFMVAMNIQIARIRWVPLHANVTMDMKVMERRVLTLMNAKATIHVANSRNVSTRLVNFDAYVKLDSSEGSTNNIVLR